MSEHEFIDKALFFPKKGILAIGDLHIGFDYMLRQAGIFVPRKQIEETLSDLKETIQKIKNKGQKINKIVFLGDLKHSFGFEFDERRELQKIFDFLKKEVPEKDIIFIKGNHDVIDYSPNQIMKPSHKEGDVFFMHGHKTSNKMLDKEVKVVVSGHLHPSALISEKGGAKKEIFKCFLEGKHKGKTFIVVPSFLNFVEGTLINDYEENYWEDFSIIPKKDMMKFRVHVIGNDEVYDFGEVWDL